MCSSEFHRVQTKPKEPNISNENCRRKATKLVRVILALLFPRKRKGFNFHLVYKLDANVCEANVSSKLF